MREETLQILSCLHKKRGFDFSGYRVSVLQRRISRRFNATRTHDLAQYFNYLQHNPSEFDELIDSLTINVSSFFRNPLTFEYLGEIVLPVIIADCLKNNRPLRIWSAGCAAGEEPFSIAILVADMIKDEEKELKLNIFATDIDKKSLKKTKVAEYPFDSVKHIKCGLLKEYFNEKNDTFKLAPKIKDMVDFSFYDLLDKKSYAPAESVFADFDIVLCRNVLIYFDHVRQRTIFDKLYRAVASGGYLVLGEAEVPAKGYKSHLRRINEAGHIYRKFE